jgi:hypothetical protein
MPWGLVCLSGDEHTMSIGMDSGWFPRFLDAYFGSRSPCELPIWRVFKNADSSTPLTGEMSWDDAWQEAKKFEQANPGDNYFAYHAIEYETDLRD